MIINPYMFGVPVNISFNFRATAAYVTDGADQTYVLGNVTGSIDTYPTTRAGYTFGWESAVALDSRNRSTSVDVRLAGINFHSNIDTVTNTFRVDLPATGNYDISLALGDAAGGNAQTNYAIVKDNTTALITFAPIATSSAQFADAAGNLWSAAAWPGSQVPVTKNFSSTILRVDIGGTIDTLSSCLANLSIISA